MPKIPDKAVVHGEKGVSAGTMAGTAVEKHTRSSSKLQKQNRGRGCWGFGRVAKPKVTKGGNGGKFDGEDGELGGGEEKRKTQLLAPLYGGLSIALSLCECFVFVDGGILFSEVGCRVSREGVRGGNVLS